MTEYKTMRVPEEAWEQARDSKRDDESWGEFLQRCSNNPPEIVEYVDASEVVANDSVITDQQKGFDWGTFDEKLQTHLGEWEITVNMDQLDLDPVGMDDDDVENIVERYLENNWRDLQQGNI